MSGSDPLFPNAAVHTDKSTAKPPPLCVKKELLQEAEEQQARGSSVHWAGPGLRLTEEARPHVYFPSLTAVSLCAYTHAYIVTPVTRQRDSVAAPEVGPIKSYMQVRWRKTRSCKATNLISPLPSPSSRQHERATCLVQ